MLFSKKARQKAGQMRGGQDLYPVEYMADSLREYQREMVAKEVESLRQLGLVNSSFTGVLEEAGHFQSHLQAFGSSFSHISEATEQFGEVKSAIVQSVSEAKDQVRSLKETSIQVERTYQDMEQTFHQLQAAVHSIQKCMGKIVSIADETNLLAINASIEAARAGGAGKGFAVVAAKVKELAEEIKELSGEVDTGIHDVESGTEQLNDSIMASHQALEESIDTSNHTYESFHRITAAAEGATSVQTQISGVIDESRRSLEQICQFFDQIKQQYQEVVTHIDHASKLGTTKSAMFEDVDNILSQIKPVVKSAEAL